MSVTDTFLKAAEEHEWEHRGSRKIALRGVDNFRFIIPRDKEDLPLTHTVKILFPVEKTLSFTEAQEVKWRQILRDHNIYLDDDLLTDTLEGRMVRVKLRKGDDRPKEDPPSIYLRYPFRSLQDNVYFPNREIAMAVMLEYGEWFDGNS